MFGNPLAINYALYELAVEYGIKSYKITGISTGTRYVATMTWFHTIKGEVINLCLADSVGTYERWDDKARYAYFIREHKRQVCRQALVDLIMQYGSVQ